MLSAHEFMTCFSKMLDIGNRQISMHHDTRFNTSTIFVKFINLPHGIGDAGGGAERENNKALFSVSGFDLDPDKLVDKVQVKEITTVFSSRLRKKTGDPWKLVFYLAKYINELAANNQPNFTHTQVMTKV